MVLLPTGQSLLVIPVDRGRLATRAVDARRGGDRLASPPPRRMKRAAMESRFQLQVERSRSGRRRAPHAKEEPMGLSHHTHDAPPGDTISTVSDEVGTPQSNRCGYALRAAMTTLLLVADGGPEYLVNELRLSWNRLRPLSRDELHNEDRDGRGARRADRVRCLRGSLDDGHLQGDSHSGRMSPWETMRLTSSSGRSRSRQIAASRDWRRPRERRAPAFCRVMNRETRS
jgi:hypothetical protein